MREGRGVRVPLYIITKPKISPAKAIRGIIKRFIIKTPFYEYHVSCITVAKVVIAVKVLVIMDKCKECQVCVCKESEV